MHDIVCQCRNHIINMMSQQYCRNHPYYNFTVYTTSDPLETSLESHTCSQVLPLGVTDQLHHQVPEGDRSRHSPSLQHMQQDDDDLETRGRFTSASATPNSQQKVLVLDRTRQAELDSPGEDQESEK